MAAHFKNIDRNTAFLLPVDMRDWLPGDDLAHFVLEAVEAVPLERFRVNSRGTGSAQFPPRMMLALLIYSYANSVFGSRRIERATHRDIGMRYVAGNTHPDHDTICKFRRENSEAINAAFLEVLKLARELKLLKVGTISIDGTQMKANASRYNALTYERACELDQQLELEVGELMKKAEAADRESAEDDRKLPGELARREALHEKVVEARRKLEARAKARAERERADYEKKLDERRNRPGSKKGPLPKPPSNGTRPDEQVNLTDEDSRIMRKSKYSGYRQAYNCQASVDADGTQLVLNAHVTNSSADNPQLLPGVLRISGEIGKPTAVLADTGYVDTDSFDKLQTLGIEPYVPPSRLSLPQRTHDFRPKKERKAKTISDPRLVDMREKLSTDAGRALYARRKYTVEPVFGIIKHAMGFTQFMLRGLKKVDMEWKLVCLAYNMKRLNNLKNV